MENNKDLIEQLQKQFDEASSKLQEMCKSYSDQSSIVRALSEQLIQARAGYPEIVGATFKKCENKYCCLYLKVLDKVTRENSNYVCESITVYFSGDDEHVGEVEYRPRSFEMFEYNYIEDCWECNYGDIRLDRISEDEYEHFKSYFITSNPPKKKSDIKL